MCLLTTVSYDDFIVGGQCTLIARCGDGQLCKCSQLICVGYREALSAVCAGERGHMLITLTCTMPTMAAEAPLMAANKAVRDAAEDMPAAVTAAFSK